MANNGKEGERLFKERMSAQGYTIQDVSENEEYFDKDIDFIITSPTTQLTKTIEVKWDFKINNTGNLYLELFNKNSKGGLGWYKFCQADYVAYGDALARCFYVVPFAELKARVERVKPPIGECYGDSFGYLMPIDSIKDLISII